MNEKSQYVETILAKCTEMYVEINERKYEGDDYINENYSMQENNLMMIGVNEYELNNKNYDLNNCENNNDDNNNSTSILYNKKKNYYNLYDNENIKRKEGYDFLTNDVIINNDLNTKMEQFVDEMLEICIKTNTVKEALGVALDARRLDKVEYIILNAPNKIDILHHSIANDKYITTSKKFRIDFFKLIVNIYLALPEEELQNEYINVCECLFYINDYQTVVKILFKLLLSEQHLMVYQIAFDLVDLENNIFLKNLLKKAKKNEKSEKDEKDDENQDMEHDILKYVNKNNKWYDKIKKLILILTGKITTSLYIEFLHHNNHADLILLDSYKNVIDSRNSITHHGIVIAHALMQTGTTCDVFLRSNIDWLSKAMNYEKFSATASLGVVYKGHINESFILKITISPSGVYSEGGSLYALGLIHANYNTNDKKVRNFLLAQLKQNTNDEVLQHGCCLGLGLVTLGQNDKDYIYDELKAVMYSDSAVAGESAAYAIGLLKLGSGDEKCVDELLAYAHDTQHEKITRACSISLGFIMFQKEKEADLLIEELINDKDAIIRYGGMFTIALAYCGLSNYNKHIIKKLLHISVSDVSDDVRRAAVIALGFVLCNNPAQVPMFLNLLIKSYNPHVRYGAALALGIACAASANEDAIDMLMPLLTDTTDFVRQSAFIALGLIFQQSNEHVNTNFKKYKDEIVKILSAKHEDIIAKFGAIIGAGLLDICGRNAISTFFTRRTNVIRPQAAVGFCLFCQLWYWFPLIHMISLTFLPTCLIGLTEDLKVPQNFTVLSNCKSQTFDYPAFLSKEKTQEKKQTVTAVLSTTAKRKSLKLRKQKTENRLTKDKSTLDDNSSVDMKNPCRVVKMQEKYIEYLPNSRFKPVLPFRKSGFIMLVDTQ
uniref:26S proteasome non-ATPase regulatory subunit 1 n=1 Tax=Piliocolobus tephrosceles TaxID=591936 RepID=A0A8C9GY65_9PRIM